MGGFVKIFCEYLREEYSEDHFHGVFGGVGHGFKVKASLGTRRHPDDVADQIEGMGGKRRRVCVSGTPNNTTFTTETIKIAPPPY